MKSADVEKCQGVKRYRMLGNRKQIYIYIYGYIRLSLLEKREKHFSSGGRFLSGSGIFRIYIGKLFRSREREKPFCSFSLV